MGEAYQAMPDTYEKTPFEEFLEGMLNVDEDACFEVEGIIWVGLKGMKEYVNAIKGFEKDLKRVGFKPVDGYELDELELDGIWYRRRIRK